MTSLADAYQREVGTHVDPRRLYLGVGLFLVGAVLAVAAILVASTEPFIEALGLTTAREYAGILGGIAAPAVFLGIFAVLPASRQTRAAAVVGAGVALLGVALFVHAFPCQWTGSNCGAGLADLTLVTAGVYFAGTLTTFWCLFVGVANFKSRNDPGGTVTLEVVREGERKEIEVPRSELGDWAGAKASTGSVGGVGLLGATPDGDVKTQTNRPGGAGATAGTADGGSDAEVVSSPGGSSAPSGPTGPTGPGGTSQQSSGANRTGVTSDGGASSRDVTTLRDEAGADAPVDTVSTRPSRDRPTGAGSGPTGDQYCGSCEHFQYVRTEEGMQPYCGFHDGLMDDMDACEEWTPR